MRMINQIRLPRRSQYEKPSGNNPVHNSPIQIVSSSYVSHLPMLLNVLFVRRYFRPSQPNLLRRFVLGGLREYRHLASRAMWIMSALLFFSRIMTRVVKARRTRRRIIIRP